MAEAIHSLGGGLLLQDRRAFACDDQYLLLKLVKMMLSRPNKSAGSGCKSC